LPEEAKQLSIKEILTSFNLECLKVAGYTEAEILGLGDLGAVPDEGMRKLINRKLGEALGESLSKEKDLHVKRFDEK
jgi:hypothetical protein